MAKHLAWFYLNVNAWMPTYNNLPRLNSNPSHTQSDKAGPTETRTQIARFKVQSANHCTMEPSIRHKKAMCWYGCWLHISFWDSSEATCHPVTMYLIKQARFIEKVYKKYFEEPVGDYLATSWDHLARQTLCNLQQSVNAKTFKRQSDCQGVAHCSLALCDWGLNKTTKWAVAMSRNIEQQYI